MKRQKREMKDQKKSIREPYTKPRRFNNLLDAVPAVLYTCKTSGNYAATFISESVKAQLGYNPEDFLSDPGFWVKNIHPDDAPRVLEDLKSLGEQDTYVHEYRFRHKDGTYRWMRDELRLLRDEAGNPVEIVGYWINITDLKKVQVEIENILIKSQDLVCIADFKGYLKRLNPAFTKIFGYTNEELLSEPFVKFIHQDDRTSTVAELKKLSRGISTIQFENRYRCQDGSYKWIRWSATPSVDEGNIYAIGRDITEAKQIAKELQQYRDHLEELVTERTAMVESVNKRIMHLNRVLHAIRSVSKLIIREKGLGGLIQGICKSLIETRGYQSAWIMLLDASGQITSSAEAGIGKAFSTLVENFENGRRISCIEKALKHSGVIIIKNPDPDCTGCPIYKAHPENKRVICNLKYRGKSYGMISISVPVEFALDMEEKKLFQELAQDIAFALYNREAEDQRQRAEDALRNERDFAKSLIETAQTIVLMLDKEGKIVLLNPYLEHISGYSLAEVKGKDWFSLFIPPEDRNRIRKLFTKSLGNCQTRGNVNPIVTKEGDERIIEWYDKILKDAQGHIIGLLAVGQDITERIQAEESLRKSEADFRNVFENSPLGKSITGIDGNLQINKALSSMLGYSEEELKKITWQDITYPEDIPESDAVIHSLMDGKKSHVRFEKRYIHKTGRIIWTEVNTALQRDSVGNPLYFISSVTDITQRKMTETELTLRNRISSIFLSVPDEEMYSEVLGIVLEVMKSEFGVFGYIDEHGALVIPTMTYTVWDECQVSDKTYCFPRESWGDSAWPQAIREKKTVYSNQPSTGTPEGHIRIMRHISLPIIHQGKVIGLLQVANKASDYDEEDLHMLELIGHTVAPVLDARLQRDREERERRKREEEISKLNEELEARVLKRTEELSAAYKDLESFSYSVSHDLKAPLRAIGGFANILNEEYHDRLDNDGKRYLGIIDTNIRQMGQLIDDLLTYSRLGLKEIRPEMLDMQRLVKTVFEELVPSSQKREIMFKVHKLPCAYGDPLLIRQVIVNLLSNAIKFTSLRKEARIEMGSREEKNAIVYYVRDNGVGFDMAYSNKLFEIFQRLHSTEEFEGTGIGLAIVKSVVHRHGGRVWAEGELNKGATFYFSFPKCREDSDEKR